MPRTMTANTTTPKTGTDFRRIRLLGIHASAHEVSSLMGVSNHSLIAWERSTEAVGEPRATEWRRALALAAAARRTRLAHEGVSEDELQGTDFHAAYTALTSATTEGRARGRLLRDDVRKAVAG